MELNYIYNFINEKNFFRNSELKRRKKERKKEVGN